jgi:hypothetical protein
MWTTSKIRALPNAHAVHARCCSKITEQSTTTTHPPLSLNHNPHQVVVADEPQNLNPEHYNLRSWVRTYLFNTACDSVARRLDPKPQPPQLSSLNPSTLNPQPSTLNPKP